MRPALRRGSTDISTERTRRPGRGQHAAAYEQALERLRHELDVVYTSRSWRLTAPIRDTRRGAGRLKHSVALRLERVFRSAYRRLPIRSQHRWTIKSAVFARTGWLMRGTASYKHWHGTYRRALADDSGVLCAPDAGPESARGGDSPAAIRRQPGGLGHRPRLRTARSHVALPGLDRPAPSGHTHRGDRRRRRVAGGHAVGARVCRGPARRPQRPQRGVHRKLQPRRACGARALPLLPQQRHRGACRAGATNWWTPSTPFRRPASSARSCSTPTAGCRRRAASSGATDRGGTVGKFDDPARPEYSYRREVDYVSGAALLVPADACSGSWVALTRTTRLRTARTRIWRSRYAKPDARCCSSRCPRSSTTRA